jgi:uncharacterized membrane protein
LDPRQTWTPGVLALLACAIALLAWTAVSYSTLSLALVVASLVQSGACFWSCRTLLGARNAWTFAGIGAVLGWLAEEAGSTMGWFFGDYTYTDVLGPRLGHVPAVIPLMWFGLTYIGLLLASLVLWRRPVPPSFGWKTIALAALMTAMLVTAFDLGGDPYFVYQLKAWIMTKKDGGWFGETVRGFEGWLMVSFAIVTVFLAVAKPQLVAGADSAVARKAALVPILLYAFMMVFQVVLTRPIALQVVAFFAMGIPALIAFVAWVQWADARTEAPA